ncbi:MAG: DUF3085 domain-containing protein [Mesorhizobium sp.]
MKLTFPNLELKRLLQIAEQQWPLGLRRRWNENLDAELSPGFWLVGDQGVYLMQNGKAIHAERQPVVYALECNPHTMPLETWWRNKCASFGADEGVRFVEAEVIRRAVKNDLDLIMELSVEPTRISKNANGKGYPEKKEAPED